MVWKPEPVLAPACWVSRYTTSNCLKVVNTVMITAGAMMGRMAGMVMYRARARAPAPSKRALS